MHYGGYRIHISWIYSNVKPQLVCCCSCDAEDCCKSQIFLFLWFVATHHHLCFLISLIKLISHSPERVGLKIIYLGKSCLPEYADIGSLIMFCIFMQHKTVHSQILHWWLFVLLRETQHHTATQIYPLHFPFLSYPFSVARFITAFQRGERIHHALDLQLLAYASWFMQIPEHWQCRWGCKI